MDPLSLAATVSDITSTFSLLKPHKCSIAFNGYQQVFSELEILFAVMAEAVSTLHSLTTAAPHSAEIALRQCESVGRDLLVWLEIKKDRLKRVFESERREKIKDLVAAFRVSVDLLRQIANE